MIVEFWGPFIFGVLVCATLAGLLIEDAYRRGRYAGRADYRRKQS